MSSVTFYFIIAIVPAIILHEVSHGFVANLCGDPTAKEQGRLTLNPLRHIDPFGTLLLPLLLILTGLPAFGYAKPVPVNVSRLRHPRRDGLFVSFAGPLTNLILSFIGFVVATIGIHSNDQMIMINFGVSFGLVNLTLAAFNLLPIPPLDGSAIIERFIPQRKLGVYYYYRSRAIPFVMVLVILDSMFFHIGTNFLSDLQNWWINRLIKGF